jgi:hypothetical protein
LETIIKNFSEYPEIVSKAQTDLDTIKVEESKTNSSIIKE